MIQTTDTQNIHVLLLGRKEQQSAADRKLIDKIPTTTTFITHDLVYDQTQWSAMPKTDYDITLLDSEIILSEGIEWFIDFKKYLNFGAIVIIADRDDTELENQLLAAGAQDYLNRNTIDAAGLWRVMRHAMERHQARMKLEYSHEVLVKLSAAIREGTLEALDSSIDPSLLGENAELFHQIIQQNEQLQQLADYDVLTELPNRRSFERSLEAVLALAKRHESKFCVLMIDLDGFKEVNDIHGHQMGDELLKTVAARFKSHLRQGDVIARMGGDEFAVLINSIQTEQAVAPVAEKLLTSIEQPIRLGVESIHISASIGAACYPCAGADPKTLLRNADIAMYKAKEAGGNNYQYANKKAHQPDSQRLQLETCLQDAIDNQSLTLDYQSIIDPKTNNITAIIIALHWRGHCSGYCFRRRFSIDELLSRLERESTECD